MRKEFGLAFLALTLSILSTVEAKGGGGNAGSGGEAGSDAVGRGGGTGGGRAAEKVGGQGSGRRRNSFDSSGSKASRGSHSNSGSIHGFFHISPYHYTYRPIHISTVNASSSQLPKQNDTNHNNEIQPQGSMEEENAPIVIDGYVAGFVISRFLSGDFLSIFNVVHDISKIPDKIKNKDFTPTTTTEGPVSTYNLNHTFNNNSIRNSGDFKKEEDIKSNNATSFYAVNYNKSSDYNNTDLKNDNKTDAIPLKIKNYSKEFDELSTTLNTALEATTYSSYQLHKMADNKL